MSQVLFAGYTAGSPAPAVSLDANFTELYALLALIYPRSGGAYAGAGFRCGGNMAFDYSTQNTQMGTDKFAIVDSTRSVNNRYVEMAFAGGTFYGRFLNDAYSAAAYFLSVNGGQAAGVTSVTLSTAGGDALTCDASANVYSGADNTKTLGTASRRWSVVYAGTGTINTSDAREKTPINALTAPEIEAAKLLAREIGSFKFLSAIAEKSDAARTHIGMTVQRAMEIMAGQGLDPMAYAFICHDEWPEEITPATDMEPERVRQAGDRYGFRADELLLFIAAGFEARLSALEAA